MNRVTKRTGPKNTTRQPRKNRELCEGYTDVFFCHSRLSVSYCALGFEIRRYFAIAVTASAQIVHNRLTFFPPFVLNLSRFALLQLLPCGQSQVHRRCFGLRYSHRRKMTSPNAISVFKPEHPLF